VKIPSTKLKPFLKIRHDGKKESHSSNERRANLMKGLSQYSTRREYVWYFVTRSEWKNIFF